MELGKKKQAFIFLSCKHQGNVAESEDKVKQTGYDAIQCNTALDD